MYASLYEVFLGDIILFQAVRDFEKWTCENPAKHQAFKPVFQVQFELYNLNKRVPTRISWSGAISSNFRQFEKLINGIERI
jgi:hypothetical protein